MSGQDKPQVGFMSPPIDSRFKKGQSGNRKGRPKKQDDIYTLLQRVLKRKVRLKGADRQMQIREALIRKLRDVALSGDQRALALQRRIMDEAGTNQTGRDDLAEFEAQAIEALRSMGVKIIGSEGKDV